MTSAFAVRPYTLSGVGGGEREENPPETAGMGEEYVIFSWREIVRCFVQSGIY